ncbi:F-box protein, partial [Trifolium pratense]
MFGEILKVSRFFLFIWFILIATLIYIDEGVYLSGTLNWLAIHNYDSAYDFKDITVEQFVIVSLDLGTETYNQYKFPRGFDGMMEFGVEESWTQFLKISFQNLQLDYDFSSDTLKFDLGLLPLFLSED